MTYSRFFKSFFWTLEYSGPRCGQFSKLVLDLQSRTKVTGPLTTQEKDDALRQAEEDEGSVVLQDDFALKYSDVISCIDDSGIFVVTEMDKLDDAIKKTVDKQANCTLGSRKKPAWDCWAASMMFRSRKCAA